MYATAPTDRVVDTRMRTSTAEPRPTPVRDTDNLRSAQPQSTDDLIEAWARHAGASNGFADGVVDTAPHPNARNRRAG